jgi:hypothetical protein
LQNRKAEAGAIARVAAPEIEELVVAALRHHVDQTDQVEQIDPIGGGANLGETKSSTPMEIPDRDLVALHVERIVLRARHIELALRLEASDAGPSRAAGLATEGPGDADQSPPSPTVLQIPWAPTTASARKGVAWKSSAQPNLNPATIEALLTAIAKARSWMSDLAEGRASSFQDIARREDKVERHIRNLAPLAFVSPRVIEAIANGAAPADLTVTTLAHKLPHRWAEQEKLLGAA